MTALDYRHRALILDTFFRELYWVLDYVSQLFGLLFFRTVFYL
jgi:hypothetical protein